MKKFRVNYVYLFLSGWLGILKCNIYALTPGLSLTTYIVV